MWSESGSDTDYIEVIEFMWERDYEDVNFLDEEERLRIADAEFSDEEDEVLFGQDNRVAMVYFSQLRRVKHNDTSERELNLERNNAISMRAWA